MEQTEKLSDKELIKRLKDLDDELRRRFASIGKEREVREKIRKKLNDDKLYELIECMCDYIWLAREVLRRIHELSFKSAALKD